MPEPTTIPIVPITAPRWPCTRRPPVWPISTGSRTVIIGPTISFNDSLGVQPVGMDRADRSPRR